MPPIAYVENVQLDLRARKRLAAWLVHLVGHAHLDENSDEHTPDHANYTTTVKAQILSTLHDDSKAQDPLSLVAFLDMYLERVSDHTAAHKSETFTEARRKMGAMRDAFDCGKCGAQNKWCKGGEADLFQFRHEAGGRCLDFLRKITQSFVEQAEMEYRRVLGSEEDVNIVPALMLATWRKNGSRGTLPIDGEFRQPDGTTDAIIKVYWPMDDDLGKAIYSLPYLVFHEVFVHGAQGAALSGERFIVDQDCAFTEGAVDAVACEILQKEVLVDEETLPDLLQPLAKTFWEASQKYHVDRYEMPDIGSTESGDDIRRARARGRNQIYGLMLKLQKIGGKPKGWAEQVILTLNLYLSQNERKELYQLMKQASHRRQRHIALVDPLNQFIRQRDVGAMMRAIKRNLGLKMPLH